MMMTMMRLPPVMKMSLHSMDIPFLIYLLLDQFLLPLKQLRKTLSTCTVIC